MRTALERNIWILFAIAALGLLGRNLRPLDSLGVALSLTLLCGDQGRMALVDLSNIRRLTLNDARVRQFYLVTLITIVLELVGFYIAWVQLGMGTALVLVSQLFFNVAVNVRLSPDSVDPVQPFALAERLPVLIANTVALSLVSLWQMGQLSQPAAALLVAMVLAYLAIKYGKVRIAH